MEESIKENEEFVENSDAPESPLDDFYEVEDITYEPTNPLEEAREEAQEKDQVVSTWSFDDYISKRLGLEDGKFITGSQENPIEKDIKDLNQQQKVALLEEYHKANAGVGENLSQEEQTVLGYLRQGDLEGLYGELSEELGKQPAQQQFYKPTEEEIIRWKVETDNPGLSEEDLIDEIDLIKNSPRYESKVQSYYDKYDEAVQAYQQQQEYEEFNKLNTEVEQIKESLINAARGVSEIGGFELDEEDDDIKNEALSDLLEYNEGSKLPRFMEYVNTPEGMVQTAITMKSLPKIHNYINSLHQKIEELESGKETIIETRDEQSEEGSYFDPSDPVDPFGLNRR